MLLDARYPFANKHFLPAGPLRERDLSRADIIIFTHANYISDDEKQSRCALVAREKGVWFAQHRIIFGEHAFQGIEHVAGQKTAHGSISTQRFHAVAGIGSFDQFCAMLDKNGIKPFKKSGFDDHHTYTVDEVVALASQELSLVTTEKDWVKIEPLLQSAGVEKRQNWFVAHVAFQPISEVQPLADCLGMGKKS